MTQGIYASLINTEYTDKVVAFVKGRSVNTQAKKSKVVANDTEK